MTASPQPLTPTQIWQWGFTPIPLRATGDTKAPAPMNWQTAYFHPSDWQPGQGVGLRCGLQTDGSLLYFADYDHKPDLGIDAPAEFQKALDRIPESIRAKLFKALSTSRRGRYFAFRCLQELHSTYLRDERGRKIGDFLGGGKQVVTPQPDRWIDGTLADIPVFESPEEVAAILQAINYRPGLVADSSTIDWQAVNAVDVAPLLRNGLPARFMAQSTGAKILRDERATRDRSDARYGVAGELVKHGYTDTEAAALLLHLCDYGHGRSKGVKWLQKDIARIIGKAHQTHPEAVAKPYTIEEQHELPDMPRANGRPRKQTVETYLFCLRQNLSGANQVMLTQGQIAEMLCVSKRSVQRWEAELQASGRIERRKVGNRGVSFLLILDDDKTPTTQIVPALRPQAPVGEPCWSCEKPEAHRDSAGVLRCRACGEFPVVARLVHEALDATAAMRHGAKRRAVVVAFVQASGRPDASATFIQQLCDEYHQERRQDAADEQLAAKLRTLSEKQLKTKLRSLGGKQRDAYNKGSPGQAWVWGRIAWWVQKELDRREPPMERAA